jgi:FdhE protein
MVSTDDGGVQMNAEVLMLEPGKINAPAGQIRFLFLPERNLFARRAERLRHLSPGHPLEDYLNFLALLADKQQKILDQFPLLVPPGPAEQAVCQKQGMPLLNAQSWPRNPAWREGLTTILQKMGEASLPPAAREAVEGLMQERDDVLEAMADRILGGDFVEVSPQALPFIASALQVYWVHMATALAEETFGRLEQGGLCPVCGSTPNAGIVKAGGAEQGLRYLCCSLCGSQWHMVRIKCSNCGSTQRINHYALKGSNGAVKAESCDDCNTYLKLLYLEKDSRMEAGVDDLATLTLDMLMDKAGKDRGGPNLFFHPGRPVY